MFGASKPGGLFGSTQSNTFGSTQSNTFGNTQGNTFGQSTQQTSLFGKPQQQTSLFGAQQPQQPQQQQQQTSLFGSTQQPQQQPQQTSLFGQSNTQNQQTSLFGTQNQQQPQQTSLFGNTQPQQPQQTSLFGSNNTQSGGLFGSKPATSQPQTSLFNTSNSLQVQPQQQQQQLPTITPFTRPGDMPQQFQEMLMKMEGYIRNQQQLSEDLSHATLQHKELVESIPQDVQLLKFKVTSAKETLLFDDGQLAKLKREVDLDFADSELLVDVINQPRKYDRLLPYFQKKVDVENRLEDLSMAMRDVRHVMNAEEFGKRVTYGPKGVEALPGALKEEHLYFMSLSDRVAELDRSIRASERTSE